MAAKSQQVLEVGERHSTGPGIPARDCLVTVPTMEAIGARPVTPGHAGPFRRTLVSASLALIESSGAEVHRLTDARGVDHGEQQVRRAGVADEVEGRAASWAWSVSA